MVSFLGKLLTAASATARAPASSSSSALGRVYTSERPCPVCTFLSAPCSCEGTSDDMEIEPLMVEEAQEQEQEQQGGGRGDAINPKLAAAQQKLPPVRDYFLCSRYLPEVIYDTTLQVFLDSIYFQTSQYAPRQVPPGTVFSRADAYQVHVAAGKPAVVALRDRYPTWITARGTLTYEGQRALLATYLLLDVADQKELLPTLHLLVTERQIFADLYNSTVVDSNRKARIYGFNTFRDRVFVAPYY